MTVFFRRFPAFWVLLLLVVFSQPAHSQPQLQQDSAELEQRLEMLREEIARIRDNLAETLQERDAEAEALREAERSVSAAERQRRETLELIEALNRRIAVLETQRGELEASVGEAAAALGRQLTFVYRQGGQSRLKLMLNQDDWRQINRHLAYHGYLTRARLGLVEELRDALGALENNRLALLAERASLEQVAAEQADALARLDAARARRADALAAIEQQVVSERERLDSLEQDAEELSRLIDELADALADIPPDIEAPNLLEQRGQLPMPVSGPVRQRFGSRRAGDLVWNGWLIAAEREADVRAIAHGRVAYADWLRGYGLILIIDHGEGFMSLYAHAEALLRDVGDWVRPGDVIATVGNSGGVPESGLYFELRRDGRPVDPAAWLSR
ncbi:MAG: murein hydrolase activator EnvC family protein [Wenzhouxiangella sp.]